MSTELERLRAGELDFAATIAVTSALRLQLGEKLVVVGDRQSAPIADALERAAYAASARVARFDLDGFGPRPLKALPDPIAAEMSRSDASTFVASAPRQELLMRQHLLHVVGAKGLRHAHMPGLSRIGFQRGMRVDYGRVQAFGRSLLAKLEGGARVESESAAGTLLSVRLPAGAKWHAQLGVLAPGRWGNLPAGAIYTTTDEVDGVFVANASMGEFFGAREGVLTRKPVKLTIRRGRVVHVEAPHSRVLEREIEMMMRFGENSDRVGLVAIGVNVGLRQPTGEAIVDQNLPGLHIGIGDPAARATGAPWQAPTSFAVCQEGSSVYLDGCAAIVRGEVVAEG